MVCANTNPGRKIKMAMRIEEIKDMFTCDCENSPADPYPFYDENGCFIKTVCVECDETETNKDI